ncbi:MAG: tRNA pseudouridine(38-40) synthase TruA [Leptospirales bacterium]|nr:tRNA pseudouridine(38-40) synthase TruA [Leptospirales bacterium]
MNRYALLVQYDGTLFNGWQFQDKGRSIQVEFETAIKILTKENVRVIASGRTDSGVHALGQVVHFDLSQSLPLQRLCMGLNGILPHELGVKNAYKVDFSFHSRFSAVQREYLYIIYNYPLRTPFMRYKAMWINYPIDAGYIKEAASKLVGEHDFASFCKKISAKEGTIRKIDSIEVTEDRAVIKLRFKANAFLHNMIRIIVGTILQMQREGRDPEYITEILNGKDRSLSGFTAPPYGLYLNRVTYDPALNFYESAF